MLASELFPDVWKYTAYEGVAQAAHEQSAAQTYLSDSGTISQSGAAPNLCTQPVHAACARSLRPVLLISELWNLGSGGRKLEGKRRNQYGPLE